MGDQAMSVWGIWGGGVIFPILFSKVLKGDIEREKVFICCLQANLFALPLVFLWSHYVLETNYQFIKLQRC